LPLLEALPSAGAVPEAALPEGLFVQVRLSFLFELGLGVLNGRFLKRRAVPPIFLRHKLENTICQCPRLLSDSLLLYRSVFLSVCGFIAFQPDHMEFIKNDLWNSILNDSSARRSKRLR